MTLTVLDGLFAICRLGPADSVPAWAQLGAFCSITRTDEELSIVCSERAAPTEIRAERSFRAVKVQGPLDFNLTGILAELTATLAAAKVSLFAVSTYDTDYIFVRDKDLLRALQALRAAGHSVQRSTVNG